MKKILILIIAGFLLMGVCSYANDVKIDSVGNVTTGIDSSGNLEVTGSSGEHGIVGKTDGTGAAGVSGENTTFGNYGLLGYYNYGVYGYSLANWAGYFDGDVNIDGNLSLTGTLTGYTETDPVYSTWDKSSGITITESQISDLTHTTYTAGTGLDLGGSTFSVEVPLVLSGSVAYGGIFYGTNSDDNGYGVYGYATGANGHGVYGYATNNGDVANYGGYFQAYGTYGRGVQGDATGSMGSGVFGYATGTDGKGVYGTAAGTNGVGVHGFASSYGDVTNYGGYFSANGDTGRGVFGHGSGAEGIGVYGLSNTGTGGYFTSNSGYGLIVENGNVGIGTTSPGEPLTVAGIIESKSGGIKFPDGTVQTTAAAPTYLRTVIINPIPGDTLAGGTALLNALAGITGASATNPYLLKIEPGVYDLGNNGLAMKEYVDLEGSGEKTTIITSTHSSTVNDATSATVIGADNAEIRLLTVENQGGSNYSIAIFNNGASPDLTNVTATASGGSYSYGVSNFNYSSPKMTNVTATASSESVNYAVYNYNSSPIMTNVTATASGGGNNDGVLNNYFSSPTMTNVTATASGGTYNSGVSNFNWSSPTIKFCSISSPTYGIINDLSTAKVGSTMLDGAVYGSGFTCVGAYDASFTALDSSCL